MGDRHRGFIAMSSRLHSVCVLSSLRPCCFPMPPSPGAGFSNSALASNSSRRHAFSTSSPLPSRVAWRARTFQEVPLSPLLQIRIEPALPASRQVLLPNAMNRLLLNIQNALLLLFLLLPYELTLLLVDIALIVLQPLFCLLQLLRHLH